MRILLLTTGIPGSGKTTLLKKMGISHYSICPDDIRLLLRGAECSIDGQFSISQSVNRKTWRMVFDILESRMANGDFTIVDATHTKRSYFDRYKNLADKYKYKIYTISLRDVPLDVCKERNKQRDSYKAVPDHILEEMHKRFSDHNNSIPRWANEITPEDFSKFLLPAPELDFSHYEKIIHIGDIHACIEPLKKAIGSIADVINNTNTAYVFVGDYIDRGPQNVETIKFLLEIYKLPNVYLLEGNHETWLWYYATKQMDKIKSKEFTGKTMLEIEKSNLQRQDIVSLCLSMIPVLKYKFHDKKVLVTHGGVPLYNFPNYIMSTQQLIKGVGNYSDYMDVASAFKRNADKENINAYLINGHRNVDNIPIQANSRAFNLEGGVETGGELRIVELTKDGFNTKAIQNKVQHTRKPVKIESVRQWIEELRKNPDIQETYTGGFSSFHFTRDVFYNKKWNNVTTMTRGLFINTADNSIIARGYDKFFEIGEIPETSKKNLWNLSFPVNIYMKYNGYLGLLGYDESTEQLVFASKKSVTSTHAYNFKEIFEENVDSDGIQFIKEYLRDKNVCMLFEVVDPVNDPHIIEYDRQQLFLLDLVKRQIEFEPLPFRDVKRVAAKAGLTPKELITTCTGIYELNKFIDLYNDKNKYFEIEGFVIVDQKNYMLKFKTYYYKLWKQLRAIKDRIARDKDVNIDKLDDDIALSFYRWLLEQDKDYIASNSIINLRKDFYQSTRNKEYY